MVKSPSSKRNLLVRVRLIVKGKICIVIKNYSNNNWISNLIGKGFSCHENRYRFDAGLIRKIYLYYYNKK